MKGLEFPDKIFGVETQMVKIFLLPGALILFWIISLVLVVIPKINEGSNLAGKVKGLKSSTLQLESKKAYLMSIDQDLVSKNSEYLNMALLNNKDAYILVNVVRDTVMGFGYSVDSFSISPGEISNSTMEEIELVNEQSSKKSKKVVSKDLQKIPISLSLVGPTQKFMDLVGGIERSLPILSIERMDLKTSGEVSTISMVVSSYFSTPKTSEKMNNISLAELTLTEEENQLVNNISQYKKIEGLNAADFGLLRDKEFVKYPRDNPFTP